MNGIVKPSRDPSNVSSAGMARPYRPSTIFRARCCSTEPPVMRRSASSGAKFSPRSRAMRAAVTPTVRPSRSDIPSDWSGVASEARALRRCSRSIEAWRGGAGGKQQAERQQAGTAGQRPQEDRHDHASTSSVRRNR